MNLLKKLWSFLFEKKEEEPVVLETAAEESTVNHCATHLRFRKHCLDCLRVVGAV